MSLSLCSGEDQTKKGVVNVTTQADIDEAYNTHGHCWQILNVIHAERSLNFTKNTDIVDILVADSPDLESLSFPRLEYLSSFEVEGAEKLTEILLPRLTAVHDFIRTGASALETIDLGDDFDISGSLILLGNGDDYFEGTYNLTGFQTLEIDNPQFVLLKPPTNLDRFTFHHRGGDLDIHGLLSNLTSITDLEIKGQGRAYTFNYLPSSATTPSSLTIKGSLLIEGLVKDEDSYDEVILLGADEEDTSSFYVGNVQNARSVKILNNVGITEVFSILDTVDKDVEIINNTNITIKMDGLSTVDKDVEVVNNTNTTVKMDGLSIVKGDLKVMDNLDSDLPSFPGLERAKNIHLRGHFDTNSGPNIFPNLKSVTNVTIEPRNSDFDCSKLVSQHRDKLINNLYCSGINNSTDSASSGLTEGTQIGIGVGVGIFAVISIIAGVLFYIRRNYQPKTPSNMATTEPDVKSPDLSGRHEVNMDTVVREIPTSGAIYEMHVPPTEIPDNHIRELAVRTPELPSHITSQRYFDVDHKSGRGGKWSSDQGRDRKHSWSSV
ncbi:hypothetical protein GGS20DRAFT_47236 [Poronia punctata]|nr:hypothetical protein GGS20DRAFT_47236 [Poronia punctata]